MFNLLELSECSLALLHGNTVCDQGVRGMVLPFKNEAYDVMVLPFEGDIYDMMALPFESEVYDVMVLLGGWAKLPSTPENQKSLVLGANLKGEKNQGLWADLGPITRWPSCRQMAIDERPGDLQGNFVFFEKNKHLIMFGFEQSSGMMRQRGWSRKVFCWTQKISNALVNKRDVWPTWVLRNIYVTSYALS